MKPVFPLQRRRPSVQQWVRPRRRGYRWLGVGLTAMGLGLGGLGLVATLHWGTRLMLNPGALPGRPWAAAEAELLTLEALQAQTAAARRRLGSPLSFDIEGATYQLFPLRSQDGARILAVAAYRVVGEDSPQLQPVAELAVPPLPQATALAPLLALPEPPSLGSEALSFTHLKPMAADRGWLTLEGQWQRGGQPLRYGQILFFDPRQPSLTALSPWSSPVPRPPQWRDLDGSGAMDLLVDETVGMEPRLQGLRVVGTTAVSLQPVSLLTVPDGVDVRPYRAALALARAGLWSQAARQLERLQQLQPAQATWPPLAEAQLRLVQLHAQRTRQQAEQTWSSPSQQILAQLIDGRWQAALQALEVTPLTLSQLQPLLAGDRRIWNRVTASLGLGNDSAALVWGALVLHSQQDLPAAQQWLQHREADGAVTQRLQRVLAAAQPPPVAQTAPAVPMAAARSVEPLQGLVGQVLAAPEPGTGWYPPTAVEAAAAEPWYVVRVLGHRRQQWQVPPPYASAADTWRAAENLDLPGLQLRGVRHTPTGVELLVSGSAVLETDWVQTAGSLRWLETLAAEPVPEALAARVEETAADLDVQGAYRLGDWWGVRLGEQSGEMVVFDGEGELIYSDLGTENTLVAVSVPPERLLVLTPQGPQLVSPSGR